MQTRSSCSTGTATCVPMAVVHRGVLFCCLRVSQLDPVRVVSCMDGSSKTLMPDCPAALLPDWGSGLGSKAAVAPCLTLEDV
jgi:hypothetical protein